MRKRRRLRERRLNTDAASANVVDPPVPDNAARLADDDGPANDDRAPADHDRAAVHYDRAAHHHGTPANDVLAEFGVGLVEAGLEGGVDISIRHGGGDVRLGRSGLGKRDATDACRSEAAEKAQNKRTSIQGILQ